MIDRRRLAQATSSSCRKFMAGDEKSGAVITGDQATPAAIIAGGCRDFISGRERETWNQFLPVGKPDTRQYFYKVIHLTRYEKKQGQYAITLQLTYDFSYTLFANPRRNALASSSDSVCFLTPFIYVECIYSSWKDGIFCLFTLECTRRCGEKNSLFAIYC